MNENLVFSMVSPFPATDRHLTDARFALRAFVRTKFSAPATSLLRSLPPSSSRLSQIQTQPTLHFAFIIPLELC